MVRNNIRMGKPCVGNALIMAERAKLRTSPRVQSWGMMGTASGCWSQSSLLSLPTLRQFVDERLLESGRISKARGTRKAISYCTYRISTKLLHPPLSPSSQATEISLRIVTSPLSQRKPKVAYVFPCLDCRFVIGRLIEESLRGERQLLLCSYTEKDDA